MADLITTPGAADADAYVALAVFKAWADALGYAYGTDDEKIKAAIRRATSYVDRMYAAAVGGEPVNGRDQALAFPMYGLTDAKGYALASDAIPREVVLATCEGTVREVAKPGVLMPDVKAGAPTLKRVKTGDTELEYATSGGGVPPRFVAIDAAMAGLLSPTGGVDAYSAPSVRA